MPKRKEFRTVRGYQLLNRESKPGLTPSMEDYLEMIYRRCQTEDFVRVNELADQLHVQSPSVSRTVRKLADLGYVKYHKYGVIQLTESGRQLGSYLLDRHETVEKFLQNLGVVENLLRDTELIEHYLSHNTLQAMETWNEFLAVHPHILQQVSEFRERQEPDLETP